MADSEYVHVEKLAVAWLDQQAGGPVYTETDTELESNLPASKLEVVGGSGAAGAVDRTVLIEVDSFGLTRAAAWDKARANDKAMLSLATNGTESWYVDEVRCTFHPSIEPYTNPEIRRASAMYELVIRAR